MVLQIFFLNPRAMARSADGSGVLENNVMPMHGKTCACKLTLEAIEKCHTGPGLFPIKLTGTV